MARKSKVTNEALNMDDDKPIEEVVKKEKETQFMDRSLYEG